MLAEGAAAVPDVAILMIALPLPPFFEPEFVTVTFVTIKDTAGIPVFKVPALRGVQEPATETPKLDSAIASEFVVSASAFVKSSKSCGAA